MINKGKLTAKNPGWVCQLNTLLPQLSWFSYKALLPQSKNNTVLMIIEFSLQKSHFREINAENHNVSFESGFILTDQNNQVFLSFFNEVHPGVYTTFSFQIGRVVV